jgi:hypothetical protein
VEGADEWRMLTVGKDDLISLTVSSVAKDVNLQRHWNIHQKH